MKRFCRFLAMFLLLTTILAPSAMAVNTPNEEAITSSVSSVAGANRIFEDFEEESFSQQNQLTPAIVGTAFKKGSVPSATALNSLKFGNLRSVISADGLNTYAEWRFHEADEITINGKEDAYVSLGKRSYDITNFSYQVLEFDLTTMTTFPSNLWIFSEWLGSDSSGTERVAFGSYNDTDGLWHFGDKTLKIEENEWVHITLVFSIQRTGTDAYNFSTTTARIFINGELYNEIHPYSKANLGSGVAMKQHYLGIGWPYGEAGYRTGMDENCSVCFDNVTLTTFDRSTYTGNLEDVFASDFTNLSDFDGEEFVYSPEYVFPSSSLAVATVTDPQGKITSFVTLESAVEFVTENALSDAKITLLADQYHPIKINTALTLDLNGHTLYGQAITANDVVLSSMDNDIWTFSTLPVRYAQILFYQSPFIHRDTAEASFLYEVGDSVSLIPTHPYANTETGEQLDPTGNWLVYDIEGNLLNAIPETIKESDIGKTYIFCPEYYDPSIYFTLIKANGTIEQHSTLDLLSKIPSGATVILRKDIPVYSSFLGTNYSVDINGYTLYTPKGNTKKDIFNGKGSVYVYSSREGARVLPGVYRSSSSTDANGNLIYTNQASFIVTDAHSSQGTRFMIGYKNETEPTPYRIDMFCASFAQLGSVSNISIYLNNLNIIASASDNKAVFTTRYNKSTNRYWQIDNCDILITNKKVLCGNVDVSANTGTYVFNNTNIRGNGALFGSEKAVTADCHVTFNNTNTYGTFDINPGAASYTDSATNTVYNYTRILTIQGKCTLSSFTEDGIVLPQDYIFIPKSIASTSGRFLYPDHAQYANLKNGNYSIIGGAYTANGYIGKSSEYVDTLLQSVALDSSVNVLLYLPKSSYLKSVSLDEVNLLNKTQAKMINGEDYLVVRLSIPPKEAYKERSLCIQFNYSTTEIELPVSLIHYAEKLSQVEDTSATGTYYEDAQEMMRYVLYYVRTAATSIGTATNSNLIRLDALLNGFALTSSDKAITENVYPTTSVSGKLTAATLNLDTKVGMVFQVAKGFVGSIRVDMPHCVPIVKTYTTNSAASSEEYIVLKNIPAYALREDVTITITPASGSKTIFIYNLATYVKGTRTDIAYAVYAYAKMASAYHVKYPNTSSLGD